MSSPPRDEMSSGSSVPKTVSYAFVVVMFAMSHLEKKYFPRSIYHPNLSESNKTLGAQQGGARPAIVRRSFNDFVFLAACGYHPCPPTHAGSRPRPPANHGTSTAHRTLGRVTAARRWRVQTPAVPACGTRRLERAEDRASVIHVFGQGPPRLQRARHGGMRGTGGFARSLSRIMDFPGVAMLGHVLTGIQ